MAAELATEEGTIYGQVPQAPEEPADIHGMFEAVGVPEKTGPDADLPFSLEWYAGARDRQIARDAELDKLYIRRNEIRVEWAEIIFADLKEWGSRADRIAEEPSPTRAMAELLARTAMERPGNVKRTEMLREALEQADEVQQRLTDELRAARAKLTVTEDAIQHKVNEEGAAELERQEKKRQEAERRKKAEKALRRNEALLRGEDPDLLDEEEEDEEDAPASPPAPTSPPAPAALPQAFSAASLGAPDLELPEPVGQPAGRLPPLAYPPKPPERL